MRLFAGFRPSAEAADHLFEAVTRICSSGTEGTATAPKLRWTPLQRWHVTLAFLGEVDPAKIPRLRTALDEVAAHHGSLTGLRIAGSGTFPGVLWMGIEPTERHSPSDQLARHVRRSMRSLGIPVERRPWRAHLTIARQRSGDLRGLAEALSSYVGPVFTVDSISLEQSTIGPTPTYTDLHWARLATAATSD